MNVEYATQRHHERFAAAIAEHDGDVFAIPRARIWELQEANRQDLLQIVSGEAGPVPPERRHDKTRTIMEWVRANIGTTVTAAGLAEVAGASISTGHAFIRDQRWWFQQIGSGTYVIIDADAARAAAKTGGSAPTLPQGGPDAPVAAAHALAAFTGHEAPARREGKA